MAQLIKLQDYVSRYEQDVYRYPSQYIRLKKQQWEKLKESWRSFPIDLPLNDDWEIDVEEKKSSLFKKMTTIFKKEQVVVNDMTDSVEKDSNDTFGFSPILTFRPETEDDLKQLFLNQLFNFQLKWASSTIYEKSNVQMRYFHDERLHTLLQRFPDTCLILYEPIFYLKKAPIEMDIILITPMEVWCITFLEQEKDAVFLSSHEHFWLKRSNKMEKKVLNPTISLNRMAKIVRQLLNHYNAEEIPVKKGIICRNGYIDFFEKPHDIFLLEKREYPKWFEQIRNNRTPLKHMQLKAAKILLDNCQTASFKRVEWEEEYTDPFGEESQ